jgi:hypothetical protein
LKKLTLLCLCLVLFLFLVVEEVCAECIPGSGRYNGWSMAPYDGIVPSSLLPPGPDKPDYSSQWSATSQCSTCPNGWFCQCQSFPGAGWDGWTPDGVYKLYNWSGPQGANGCGQYYPQCWTSYKPASGDGDYDCDGIPDSQDQLPATPLFQMTKGGMEDNLNTAYDQGLG